MLLVVGNGVHAGRTSGAGYPWAASTPLQDTGRTVRTLQGQCGKIRRPTQQVHLPHGTTGKYEYTFLLYNNSNLSCTG